LKHRDKQSKALATHRLSIAFLLALLGKLVRTIKDRNLGIAIVLG